MTIPDPSHNPTVTGHDEALRQIREAFAGGRMHHAWLISGIEGIGKATMGYHIAHHVLSNGENTPGNINAKHPSAKLVISGAHPDMLVIRRGLNDKGDMRDTIPVEEALKVATFLHKTATYSGWRVVIIDEVHTLNRHGQNAILKILEEPPPQALILMTATSPGALLPTIRSRCRQLPLEPLNDANMKTILARFAPEVTGDELAHLIALAGGSAGFALKVIRTESLPLYEELRGLLGELPNLDIAHLHKLADRIGRKADAESFDVITALLTEILRRAVHARATGEQGADTPMPPMPLDRALEVWDKTRETFAMADGANLDKKLAFVNAMTEIRRSSGYL